MTSPTMREALSCCVDMLHELVHSRMSPTQDDMYGALKMAEAALAADDAARGTMREQFDAHMSEDGKWPAAVERSGDHYKLAQTQSAWTTWQACCAQASRSAAPQSVEPVWVQPDHLAKARRAPFLCRVEPAQRDDFVPLYTTPPTSPTDAEWLEEAMRLHEFVKHHTMAAENFSLGSEHYLARLDHARIGTEALCDHLSTRPPADDWIACSERMPEPDSG